MNRNDRRFSSPRQRGVFLGAGLAALAVLFAGCGKKPAAVAPPPQEVAVVTVATEAMPATAELPGRIDAVRTAEVRARVAGILLKEVYREGSDVTPGEVLFQIDPAPLQASLDSAKAALAKADASLKESQAQADRYATLVKIHAVSMKDYETAVSTAAQDEAAVLAAKAALETAGLNLGYATVTAPIAGRIGNAMVTEGALVSATEATQLAIINQLDPVYFDFTQSSTEVLRLKREMENGSIQSPAPGEARVRLILEDGTIYPHAGKLLFSGIAVDPTTGMITLRSEVPNPEHLLMPGMFARAQIVEGVNTNALTIPQRTISRGAGGASTVLVVDGSNKVELRSIEIGGTVGTKVVVSTGLKAGERIIVEGSQKAPPGSVVKPVPFTPAAKTAAAATPPSN